MQSGSFHPRPCDSSMPTRNQRAHQPGTNGTRKKPSQFTERPVEFGMLRRQLSGQAFQRLTTARPLKQTQFCIRHLKIGKAQRVLQHPQPPPGCSQLKILPQTPTRRFHARLRRICTFVFSFRAARSAERFRRGAGGIRDWQLQPESAPVD